MSSSATPSTDGVSSFAPDQGNASEELQEIEPVPSTFIEDLCFARPSGLPIIKDLSPTNAGIFYYAVDNFGGNKGPRTSRPDIELIDAGPGDLFKEDIGTDLKDPQPSTSPPIASDPPKNVYKTVPLAAMTSTASTNNPPKKDERYVQITCIQTFAEEEIKKLFDPSSDVKYSDQLFQIEPDEKDPFMSAVRVRAGNKSHTHNIFVGLPYLGCGSETDSDSISQDEIKNGLTLPCYRGLEGDAQPADYGMRVWQSWQILFDDTRLALIHSPNSPSSNRAPLFTHQPVFWSLHALALNIGNQFRHEVQPLKVLRATVNDDISNIDTEISKHVLVEPRQLTEEMKEDYGNTIKGSNFRLERHLSNMKTIIIVLGKQLTILRDLTTITTNQLSPHSRPAFSNPVLLPLLPQSDGQTERLTYARKVFEQLIAERETVLADMNKLCFDVKKSRKELRRELRMVREQTQGKTAHDDLLGLLSKQGATSEDTKKTLEAQGETTKKMKTIIARQGQTISVFTFITAIFLPLEFFAQYLGMNSDVWSGVSTHEEFWRISGPITVFVMVALIYFIYRDDDKIKLDILRITPFAGKKYKKLKQEIAHREQEENPTSKGQNEDQLGTGGEAGEQRIPAAVPAPNPSWATGKWTSFIDWWRATPTHTPQDLEAAPEAGG